MQSITLDLGVASNMVDDTPYPDKPPGEVWRKIIAGVDMTIFVDAPKSDDGIKNYIVLSNQIFVVRPDPLNEGLWIIYKQEDQQFANKNAAKDTCWGEVKGLFR